MPNAVFPPHHTRPPARARYPRSNLPHTQAHTSPWTHLLKVGGQVLNVHPLPHGHICSTDSLSSSEHSKRALKEAAANRQAQAGRLRQAGSGRQAQAGRRYRESEGKESRGKRALCGWVANNMYRETTPGWYCDPRGWLGSQLDISPGVGEPSQSTLGCQERQGNGDVNISALSP